MYSVHSTHTLHQMGRLGLSVPREISTKIIIRIITFDGEKNNLTVTFFYIR